MEERRLRTDDQARALLYEKMMAMAYQSHPYKNPIIGWMDDLENMRVEDAQEWYDRWYAPNNATLVVVGDVDAEEVFKLAQKNYGTIQKHSLSPISARKTANVPPTMIGCPKKNVKCSKKQWALANEA